MASAIVAHATEDFTSSSNFVSSSCAAERTNFIFAVPSRAVNAFSIMAQAFSRRSVSVLTEDT